jgi:hypothetical protein
MPLKEIFQIIGEISIGMAVFSAAVLLYSATVGKTKEGWQVSTLWGLFLIGLIVGIILLSVSVKV